MADYARLSQDLVLAFDTRDRAAIERLNAHYARAFTFDDLAAEIWRRVYAFRQRSSKLPRNYLQLTEAQLLVAQDAGFASWAALTAAVATGAPPLPPYGIDTVEGVIAPRRHLSDADWDGVLGVMKERGITGLQAGGLITDRVLARVAGLEHVTGLWLEGSRQLTDAGLRHLAGMPQLQHLDLTGTTVTDRGLEVLAHLPHLRTFQMTWRSGISDAGVAHLGACERLERVNLMGSATGDGVIAALHGKRSLHAFSSGRLVTDVGLRLLRGFPRMTTWDAEDGGAHLLIDGPFTNGGLENLAGLDGVFELDIFWHAKAITSDGFAHLRHLANLGALGADGALSDDVAMGHFASLPRLRKLRAQGTIATDQGFESLSHSASLEQVDLFECLGVTNAGLASLARLPNLHTVVLEGLQGVTLEGTRVFPPHVRVRYST